MYCLRFPAFIPLYFHLYCIVFAYLLIQKISYFFQQSSDYIYGFQKSLITQYFESQ